MADNSQNLMYQMMLGGMLGPNQYSQFNQGPLPIPGYRGTPTNAMGQPIASYQAPQAQTVPGTTLNTSPSSGASSAFLQQTLGMTPQQQTAGGATPDQMLDLIFPGASTIAKNPSVMSSLGINPWGGGQGGGQQSTGSTTTQPSSGDYRQAALDALSNPGKVTTPGATVPESQPLGNQTPSVLQSFLASRQGGQGAGNYSNAGFFNTLNALKGSA